MNLLIKKSDIKKQAAIFSASYCSISNYYSLLDECPKIGYSRGVYGWQCDYYLVSGNYRQVVISEGYAPISTVTAKAQKEFNSLVKKYTEKAKKLTATANSRKAYQRLANAFKKEVLAIKNWEE